MNYRFFLLFLTFLICSVLSVVVNVIYGIDIVYTHLFYIPIILAGIWYPRHAVFLAAALGLIHIACEYASAEAFKIGALLRAAMFMVVAYVTSYLVLRRRRLLNSLRESEERYRTLVENASDIVFRTDETGHFTFVNPAVLRITGYEEEEVIGKHFPTFIHPDMRDEAIKFLGRQFVKRIQNTYFEYPILTKEGHEVWLGQNTQLIVEDGHVTGFQAVARDMTERRWAEEARYHNERLRGILETAGAICHEMNQPMQIISGYMEMLLTNISENDPIHTKLDTINKQIHRMGTITKKLMKIKDHDTQDYAGFSRIIDLNKSSGKGTE